jgi:hypothetical protein
MGKESFRRKCMQIKVKETFRSTANKKNKNNLMLVIFNHTWQVELGPGRSNGLLEVTHGASGSPHSPWSQTYPFFFSFFLFFFFETGSHYIVQAGLKLMVLLLGLLSARITVVSHHTKPTHISLRTLSTFILQLLKNG